MKASLDALKGGKIVGAKVETVGTAGSQDTKPGNVGVHRVEKEAKQIKQAGKEPKQKGEGKP